MAAGCRLCRRFPPDLRRIDRRTGQRCNGGAQEEHGDIGYWNRVTDQNYEDGRYYKLIPEPPAVHIVDFTGYDGPLDENGFPVGLPDEIARYAKEQGAAPDAPQIILKRNAPNEKEDKQ